MYEYRMLLDVFYIILKQWNNIQNVAATVLFNIQFKTSLIAMISDVYFIGYDLHVIQWLLCQYGRQFVFDAGVR